MTCTIHRGELGRADVQALLAFHVAVMRAQSPAEACHVMPAETLDGPDISFFSLRDNGCLAAIGALREVGHDLGEVKSMRVAPERLGEGFGRAMLDALIEESRARDYIALLLETGASLDFAAANALYDHAGFAECGPFGGYPESPFTRFLRLAL